MLPPTNCAQNYASIIIIGKALAINRLYHNLAGRPLIGL